MLIGFRRSLGGGGGGGEVMVGPTSVRKLDSMPKETVHQPQGDDGDT